MLPKLTPDQRIAGGFLIGLAAVTIGLAFLEPDSTNWLPQCPIYEWTGLYCPGCGTTRMLYLLIHGHPLLALRENALSMILLPVVIYALIEKLFRGKLTTVASQRVGWGLAVVVITFGIVRNLPMQPFRQLAPQPISTLERPLRLQ